MTALIRNERRKLRATALNNLGVACIVTGGIAPVAAVLLGTLPTLNKWRLAALIAIWISVGVSLMFIAHRILKGLE